MKIVVKSNAGPNIRVPIPSGLVMNRFTATFVQRKLKEYGVHITAEQAVALIKALNQCRRKYPDWALVEAQSADGTNVTIKL